MSLMNSNACDIELRCAEIVGVDPQDIPSSSGRTYWSNPSAKIVSTKTCNADCDPTKRSRFTSPEMPETLPAALYCQKVAFIHGEGTEAQLPYVAMKSG